MTQVVQGPALASPSSRRRVQRRHIGGGERVAQAPAPLQHQAQRGGGALVERLRGGAGGGRRGLRRGNGGKGAVVLQHMVIVVVALMVMLLVMGFGVEQRRGHLRGRVVVVVVAVALVLLLLLLQQRGRGRGVVAFALQQQFGVAVWGAVVQELVGQGVVVVVVEDAVVG